MGNFGRRVQIQLGTEGQPGRTIEGLRVRFQIEHTRTGAPSTGVIEISNLAPESLGLLEGDGALIRLSAGYDSPLLIFRGNPSKVVTENFVTRVEAEDGGETYREARLSINLATAVTMQDVLDEAVTQLGLPKGAVRADLTDEISNGVTFSGPAPDLFDRLGQSTESDWMIQDGAFQFIERGGQTTQTVVVFSIEGRSMVSASKTDTGVEVKGFIAPQLRPGGLFEVRAERYSGTYIADKVTFVGDTHGNDFYTIARGRPV